MVIIEYFLPYNNFIVLFTLFILNIYLIFKRSYWYTFILGNILLLTFLVIIGFSPMETFLDILSLMIDFFSEILNKLWGIMGDIFDFFIIKLLDMINKIIDWILPWR